MKTHHEVNLKLAKNLVWSEMVLHPEMKIGFENRRHIQAVGIADGLYVVDAKESMYSLVVESEKCCLTRRSLDWTP